MKSYSKKIPIFIFMTACLGFFATLGHGFVLDDIPAIVNNSWIHSWSTIPQLLSSSFWAGSGQENWLYRPLTSLTFAFNFGLTSLSPWSYHLFNIIFHGMVSSLVFSLGRTWGLSRSISLCAALLFAIHPIHVEAVANIIGRSEILATFFSLIFLITHKKIIYHEFRQRWIPAVCFFLALTAKESAITALAWAIFFDYFFYDRQKLRASLKTNIFTQYGLYLASIVLYLFLRWKFLGNHLLSSVNKIDNPLFDADLSTRIMTGIALLFKGFFLLLYPRSLSPDYSYNAISAVISIFDIRLLLPLIGSFISLGCFFHAYRQKKSTSHTAFTYIFLFMLCYFAALAITSNILLPIGTIFGERLLYFPSVAFCLFLAQVIFFLYQKTIHLKNNFYYYAIPGILIFLLLFLQTISYSSAWKDNLSLFTWAKKTSPNSVKVQYNLAAAYRDQGDLITAEKHWQQALTIYPDHLETLCDLGTLAFLKNDYSRALEYWLHASNSAPQRGCSWFNLGLLYKQTGEVEKAKQAFQTFLRIGSQEFPEKIPYVEQLLKDLGN